MQELGMFDAFRLKNGDKKEYSWFSHQGNGFRYDHTWLSHKLCERVNQCVYSHTEREDKLADHSMMILELDH